MSYRVVEVERSTCTYTLNLYLRTDVDRKEAKRWIVTGKGKCYL